VLRSADDRVYRAGDDAFGAADAVVFADDRDRCWLVLAATSVHGEGFSAEQLGQDDHRRLTTWWAAVDGFALGDGGRIRTTARLSTLSALRLWQAGIDPVYQRLMRILSSRCRSIQVTQQQATGHAEDTQRDDGCEQCRQHRQYLIMPVKPMKASDMRPAVIKAMAL